MHCPKCNFHDTKVVDSRASKGGFCIRRRRQCLNCFHRFTTEEGIQEEDFFVIKRDGRRELFDHHKLFKGICKATEKRPIEHQQILNAVQQIKYALQSNYDSEVPSLAVGEEVMKKLKELDQIAYVRFASVYKDFHDISQLAQEINSLKNSINERE